MTIEKIRFEDMPIRGWRGRRAECRALDGLMPGEAINVPCNWTHSQTQPGSCHGRQWAYTRAKRRGWIVHTTCQDGVLYIGRSPVGG